MNEFIRLRTSYYEEANPYILPLLFLDNYIRTNEIINLNEKILIKNTET